MRAQCYTYVQEAYFHRTLVRKSKNTQCLSYGMASHRGINLVCVWEGGATINMFIWESHKAIEHRPVEVRSHVAVGR